MLWILQFVLELQVLPYFQELHEHEPILGPPSPPGDALISPATLSLKQDIGDVSSPCLEVQSIVFLRTPEIELLYSGDEIRNP